MSNVVGLKTERDEGAENIVALLEGFLERARAEPQLGCAVVLVGRDGRAVDGAVFENLATHIGMLEMAKHTAMTGNFDGDNGGDL